MLIGLGCICRYKRVRYDKTSEKPKGIVNTIVISYFFFFTIFIMLSLEQAIFEVVALSGGIPADKQIVYNLNKTIMYMVVLLVDSLLEAMFFCFCLKMRQVEI